MTLYSLKNSNYESYLSYEKMDEYEKSIIPSVMGCIFGAAVGDAVGVPYEVFGNLMSDLKLKTSKPVIPLNYGYQTGTHDVPPGTWSDDTSMGLSLGMSMISNNGFDQTHATDWYVSWLTRATFSSMHYTWGIGAMTGKVLTRYVMLGDLEKAHVGLDSMPTNGCVMRNFTVACYYHNSLPDAINASQKQTEITNWGEKCNVAIMMSCFQTEIIWKCIHNSLQVEDKRKSLDTIIQETLKPHLDANDPHITALYQYVYHHNTIESTPKIYVGSSFTAMAYALYGLRILDMSMSDNPYMHGLEEVIKLGGDTDTNGCIYGAMAGAYVGFDKLPKHLVTATVYGHFLKGMSMSLIFHKDLVTNKFKTDYVNKFGKNSAPKFKLEKPYERMYNKSTNFMNHLINMDKEDDDHQVSKDTSDVTRPVYLDSMP